MAKEEILIEWRDSLEMRKAEARRQRSDIWRLCRWVVPLLLAVWGLIILLILMAVPWTAEAISWWKLFLGGCVGTVVLIAYAFLMASLTSTRRYAITDAGVLLGSQFRSWSRISGYQIDGNPSEDGTRTLRLMLKNKTTRHLRVPAEIPFEKVVAIVSERVPAVRWEDLAADVMKRLMKPVPVMTAVAWGILGGLFVITPGWEAKCFPWLLAITFFVGPGSVLILIYYWHRFWKNPGIVTMGFPLNTLAVFVMQLTCVLISLHRLSPQ